MEGIPTGMGAGAEPLGAYEPGNGPPPHNIEGPGGDPRNLEEGNSLVLNSDFLGERWLILLKNSCRNYFHESFSACNNICEHKPGTF